MFLFVKHFFDDFRTVFTASSHFTDLLFIVLFDFSVITDLLTQLLPSLIQVMTDFHHLAVI